MIFIYNSLSNKIEEFKPVRENELLMYVCGPTVYNYMHIGNSRPVIFFDVVSRFFKFLGYKVTYVSNFTDIDDKIIKKAKELNCTEEEVSKKFIDIIKSDYKRLNCLPHDFNPLVTTSMPSIISFIEKLVEKDYAYVRNNDVYFDCSKVSNYGILSGQSIENLNSGARVEANPLKKNPIDFTLWKETQEGLKWNSPWGYGRPGWHTECVTMINDIFKGVIDIHGGGYDLKFPHHENEIAQSMCMYNNTIANYWMHNGFIDMNDEKMSKSIGNCIWVSDILDKCDYLGYRFLILNTTYRQLLNYKDDLLNQSIIETDKIKRCVISAFRYFELNNIDVSFDNSKNNATGVYKVLLDEFIEHMKNDFNTPNGISVISKCIKIINTILRSNDKTDLKGYLEVLLNMLWVLGMDFEVSKLTKDEIELVNRWNDAKKNKDFELADNLRKEITLKNIIL